MAEKFHSVQDAAAKLEQVIILYKGDPVLVESITEEGSHRISDDYIGIRYLKSRDRAYVKYTDDDVSFDNVELGCFKTDDTFYYLSRTPRRANNVGLARSNLDERLSFDLFASVAMHACIMGEHQSFDDALERVLQKDSRHQPFHRHAYLTRLGHNTVNVVHFGEPIAILAKNRTVINLTRSSEKFLTNILRKIGVPDVYTA